MSNHEISKLHACPVDHMTSVGPWNNPVHLGETLRTENLLSRRAKSGSSCSGQMSTSPECGVAESLLSLRLGARHWGRTNPLPCRGTIEETCTDSFEWAALNRDQRCCPQRQARVCQDEEENWQRIFLPCLAMPRADL